MLDSMSFNRHKSVMSRHYQHHCLRAPIFPRLLFTYHQRIETNWMINDNEFSIESLFCCPPTNNTKNPFVIRIALFCRYFPHDNNKRIVRTQKLSNEYEQCRFSIGKGLVLYIGNGGRGEHKTYEKWECEQVEILFIPSFHF